MLAIRDNVFPDGNIGNLNNNNNMETQELTLAQKLEVMYTLTKQVNLKYDEHAILQQYFEELKKELSKEDVNNS
jgi:hypothetical protein